MGRGIEFSLIQPRDASGACIMNLFTNAAFSSDCYPRHILSHGPVAGDVLLAVPSVAL